jgi:hypothetical protein
VVFQGPSERFHEPMFLNGIFLKANTFHLNSSFEL